MDLSFVAADGVVSCEICVPHETQLIGCEDASSRSAPIKTFRQLSNSIKEDNI